MPPLPTPPSRPIPLPSFRKSPTPLTKKSPYLLTPEQVLPTLLKCGWSQQKDRVFPPKSSSGTVLARDGVAHEDVVTVLISLNRDLYSDILEATLTSLDGFAMAIEDFWDAIEEAGWDCMKDTRGDGHHYYFGPMSFPNPSSVDFSQKHKTMVRHFELASELRRRDYPLYLKCLEEAKREAKKQAKKREAPPPKPSSSKSSKKKSSVSSQSSSTTSTSKKSKKTSTSSSFTKKSSSSSFSSSKAPPLPASPPSSSDESYWEEEIVDSDDELDSFTLTSSVRTFTFGVVWHFIQARGWKWVTAASISDKSLSLASGNVYVAPPCDGGGIFKDGNDVVNYLDGEGQGVELRREFLKSIFEKKRKARTQTTRKVRKKKSKKSSSKLQFTVNSDTDSNASDEDGFVQLDKGAEVFFTGKFGKGKAKGLGRGGRRKTRKNTNEATASTLPSKSSSAPASVPTTSSMELKVLNKHINTLVKKTASLHMSWLFSLMASSSLIFYGYGSKRNVINLFAKKLEGETIVVEGGNENVDAEAIVALVERILTNKTSKPKDNNLIAPLNSIIRGPNGGTIVALTKLTRYARAVASLLSMSTKSINLIIHSFDGPQMKERKMLEAICALKAGGVKVVVSVDNVNALDALDWDINTIMSFRHVEMHTFADYDTETTMQKKYWENTSSSATSTLGPVGGVGQILKSLAPRHAELMKLLANTQLSDGGSGGSNNGVEYRVFRSVLKTKMVINSETALKGLLVELVEHGLVTKKKVEGKEYLLIPHSNDTLDLIKNFS